MWTTASASLFFPSPTMLSPGKWHLRVPKDPVQNLKFRRFVYSKARDNPRLQRALRQACKEDVLFHINVFGWQFNPANVGREVGPFICWDFQEEALLQTLRIMLEERDDVLWEKSRELGATWLALFLDDWLCLFHNWKKLFVISHSEVAVDRTADPDSLFWKVQFIHDHLPKWITRGVSKRKLGFHYPATSSSYNGAATTERSGVGGRAAKLTLDEFSKHRDDYKILGQTADTGPRLFIGTHYGHGTAFYDLSQRPDMHKIVMHWSQHPEKRKGLYRYVPESNTIDVLDKDFHYPPDFKFVMEAKPTGGPFPGLRSPWYDRECLRRANARDVAMHLDIDPEGSVTQFFDPLKIRRLIMAHCSDPIWEGYLHYDRDLGTPLEFVEQKGGPLKLWCALKDGWPVPGEYGAGADVSRGTGATPSCFSLADSKLGQKVCEYTSAHVDPKEFASLCVALCRAFRDNDTEGAYFVWEKAGPGVEFGRKVVELGYRNVYFIVDEDSLGSPMGDKMVPGWYPAPNAKDVLLGDYCYALYNHLFINPSEEALKECLLFTYDQRGRIVHGTERTGQDPSQGNVNHADHVIADGLCYKMCKGKLAREKKEPEKPQAGSLQWRRWYHESKALTRQEA